MIDNTSQIPTKQCTKCGNTYPATAEYFSKHRGGLRPDCKQCACEYSREYRATNVEKIREYRATNAEKLREKSRKYNAANAEKRREYRTANAEKKHEYLREYYAANAEKLREKSREYYATNAEKVAKKKRQYRQTPRGKEVHGAARHRRRARKANAPSGQPFDEASQLKRQKHRCYYCGEKLTEYHIDHVIPLSRGGSDGAENKVLACPKCNVRKNAKLPHEWAEGGRLL